MKLVLKPETERFIDEQVKAGRFPTPEAMIEAALEEFRSVGEGEMDDSTVAAINEGLDQANRGEGIELETFRKKFFKR